MEISMKEAMVVAMSDGDTRAGFYRILSGIFSPVSAPQ
jgi:hypothetical protein